jgi:hypothetical protein
MLNVELRAQACGGYVVVVLCRELDTVDAENAEVAETGLPAVPRGLLTIVGVSASTPAPAASAARGGTWHAGGLSGTPDQGRCRYESA